MTAPVAPGVANRATILIVEDDVDVFEAERDVLESRGYTVRLASTGGQVRHALEEVQPDLVIVDLMLPDVDGLVLCSNLKTVSDVPVMIISGTARKWDAILGLKLGADDFLAKPFDLDYFEARVEAILRRARSRPTTTAPSSSANAAPLGELVIDRSQRRALLSGRALPLSHAEFQLLAALAGHPDAILSRDELARAAWGKPGIGGSRMVDAHIRRLRIKLNRFEEARPPLILSVRGAGYKLVPAEHWHVRAA